MYIYIHIYIHIHIHIHTNNKNKLKINNKINRMKIIKESYKLQKDHIDKLRQKIETISENTNESHKKLIKAQTKSDELYKSAIAYAKKAKHLSRPLTRAEESLLSGMYVCMYVCM